MSASRLQTIAIALSSFPVITIMRASPLPLKISWQFLIALLILGGSLYLTELSGRVTFLGSYNIDAIRNLVLLGLACMGTLFVIIQGQGRIPNVWRIWPYLLFVGWGAYSLLWTIDIEYTLRELPKLAYPILFYILATKALTTGTTDRRLLELTRNIMGFFAFLGVAASITTLLLLIRSGEWVWGSSRLLNIPMQLPTFVESAYVIFDIAAWRTVPGWRPRKWLIAFLILDVILSLTRSDIFALIVALFVVWGVLGRSWSRLFSGLFVGALLVVTLLVVDNPIKDRMFWRPHEVTLGWLVNTVLTDPGQLLTNKHIVYSGRFAYWEHVLTASRGERPALIGTGLGSSRPLIMNFRNPSLMVHSDFVAYLAELGYVGLGLFMCVLMGALAVGLRWAFARNLAPVRRAAAVILVGYVVLNVLVGIAYNPSVHVFLFHSVAMLMVAILLQRRVPLHLATDRPFIVPQTPKGYSDELNSSSTTAQK